MPLLAETILLHGEAGSSGVPDKPATAVDGFLDELGTRNELVEQ